MLQPAAHLDNWRSNLRDCAAHNVTAAYGLWNLDGPELLATLNSLLTRGKTGYEYIFPLDDHNKRDHNRPYLLPIFAEILYKTFFEGNKMGQQCKSIFAVPGGFELPEPLLALSATYVGLQVWVTSFRTVLTNRFSQVFVALDTLRHTGGPKKFSADAYANVYIDNIDTLKFLREEPGTKDMFHPLMARLFRMAQ